MKRNGLVIWFGLSILLPTCLLLPASAIEAASRDIRIGILEDGPHPGNEILIRTVKSELKKMSEGRFAISYPEEKQVNGEFRIDEVKKNAQALAADSSLDLIFALGTESAKALAGIRPLRIPVVAGNVEFPVEFGLLESRTLKPVNPKWTTSYDPSSEFDIFSNCKKLVDFQKITFLCADFLCGNNPPSVSDEQFGKAVLPVRFLTVASSVLQVRPIPDLNVSVTGKVRQGKRLPVVDLFDGWVKIPRGWVQRRFVELPEPGVSSSWETPPPPFSVEQIVKRHALYFGVESEVVVISPETIQRKIEDLKTDLVFVSHLFGFSDADVKEVFDTLTLRNLPSVTRQGRYGVEMGALAAISDVDYKESGKTYAFKIHSLLDGGAPEEIPVYERQDTTLIINRGTAGQIGFDIPTELRLDAEIIGDEKNRRQFTLKTALEYGLRENVDIVIDRLEVEQVNLQSQKALSAFLPRISASLTHTEVVESGAEGTLKVDLGQTIYDAQAIASVRLADQSRITTEKNSEIVRETLKERIILAYLNLLRAEEAVKARRKHLRNFRKLEKSARLRFQLRETGKSDVLMVGMEYKNAQYDAINAMEDLAKGGLDFNKLLRLGTKVDVELNPGIFMDVLLEEELQLFHRYQNARKIDRLRTFLFEMAMDHSPELELANAQLEQAQLEKEKVLSEFHPTLQMGISWSDRQYLDTEYSSEDIQRYDEASGGDWSAQFKLSVPIFNGGIRFKELKEVNLKILESMARLEKSRSDLAHELEQVQIAYNMNRSRVIKLKSLLTDSRENLELGKMSYLEGGMSIMDLLDLQSRVILSEMNYTTVRFQWYQSLTSLLRLVGQIDLMSKGMNHPEIREFIRTMDRYVSERDE